MNRVSWIDNLRGMSILAVIFLHCMIAVNQQAGHFTAFNELVNQLLAPVRMGLMCFISGMFVESGLRKGVNRYLRNKVSTILYPFAIWALIYGGLKFLFSSMANHPQSPLGIILGHLSGGDITWFLHSLFLFFVLIIPARRLPCWLVLALCIIGSLWLPAIPADSLFASFDNLHINKSITLFAFFYVGDWLVRNDTDIALVAQRRQVMGISLASFLLLSTFSLWGGLGQHSPLMLPLALVSIPLFVLLAERVHLRWINYIGRHSIVFYLSHYLAIQVCSKFLRVEHSTLWLDDMRFLLAFMAAVALPAVLCQLRDRGWFGWLFTLKRKRTSPLVSA
ncbi:acyltransferase family protein [Pantoea sp. GM01]|uniref:acyltransferase family protein n=1 Tax=Pantoea sp. GM01 TaxID=1144320 RepID=UPI0002713443|nr:acyltransferase family protein [Pantoea sp. GM01]EJL89836.1 putative membrane protein [Pantoea sp. GM01]